MGQTLAQFWCYRILTEDLSANWLMFYGVIHFNNVASKDIKQKLGVVVNGAWFFLDDYGSVYFNRWHHLCIAVDLDKEVLSIVAEGFVYDVLEVPGMSKNAPTSLDGRLIQDDHGLTVANYMVGNMQVFGRKLSKEEMISITAGKDCGREGDYLAWSNMVWDVKGKVIGWVNVTKEELCKSNSAPFRFVNSQGSTFEEHESFCTKMQRSRIPGEIDKHAVEELLDYYRNVALELKTDAKGEKRWTNHEGVGAEWCYGYWLPYLFRDGVWTDYYTSKPLSFTNWGINIGSSPDEAESGSCVWGDAGNVSKSEGYGGGGNWVPHEPPCHGIGGKCSTCQKPSQPLVRLRGLCKHSELTNLFTPVNDEKSVLGYVGLSMTTRITYNLTSYTWVTDNMGFSRVYATNKASLASGVLGTSQWTVFNDSRKCSPNDSYKIWLTLTGCEEDEFTCVDAKCIPMEGRFQSLLLKKHLK